MSRCILCQAQNYRKFHMSTTLRSSYGSKSVRNQILLINKRLRFGPQNQNIRSFSKNDGGGDGKNDKSTLGQTTILVQRGCDIQELPCILKKLKKNEFATICSDIISPQSHNNNVVERNHEENENGMNEENVNSGSGSKIQNKTEILRTTITDVNNEGIKVLLDNCVTSTGILSIINEIPDSYLHPELAAYAFDRIIRIETLINLKNLEHSSTVFNRLIECILKNGDPKLLLDFMEVLKTFLDLQKTVQRFCDELLLRNSNGILNIEEICECIDRFVDCKHQDEAEKFWIGIADNEKSIDHKNIKFIYKILPKLKISRRLVIGVLEQRIPHVWWNINSDDVAESLMALAQCNSSPFRTMQAFARWLNTNIHAINENYLETIIKSFTKLDFSNSQIEKALERYIKAKVLKIKSQSLISSILDHCIHFRIRNYHIMNGCSEYFICNHKNIDPICLKSIITCLGYLDFQPLSSTKFWMNIENYLKENFSKIKPHDLIDIFLHCCYLEMFPLNFVSSIFNPYFLDQIHSDTQEERLPKIRSDLKLLDATLTLECNNYAGPMLPRDHSAKSIWQDGRIKRMTNSISDLIEKIAGGPDNYTTNVVIGKLPINSLYIIDILIHPPGLKNFWSFSIRNDRNVYVALLMFLPEHYNSTGEFLIGPQVMRIRHLRYLGLKVVTLDFDRLAKLRMHPKQLHSYLLENVKNALQPTPL